MVTGFPLGHSEMLVQGLLSHTHPLTGLYQTFTFSSRLPPAMAGFFNPGAALLEALSLPAALLGDPRELEHTVTIDAYDANLRPTAYMVESRKGNIQAATRVTVEDQNDDGLADMLMLDSPVPLESLEIPLTPIDTDTDGNADYVRVPYKPWLPASSVFLLPLADTNGDGIPDSPAWDLDGDGEPDSDLSHFPFLAGPANPTVVQKLYFAQFGDGKVGAVNVFSEITLFNLDLEDAATVRVLLKDDNGNPLTVDLNGEEVTGEKDLVIAAGAMVVLKTDGQGPITVGSVVVCSDRAVGGVILFGGSAGVAGVGVSHRQSGGFVANIESDTAEQINTGIAVMNPETKQVTYTLVLCDLDGKVVGTSELTLPSMGHRSLFVNEIDWTPDVDLSYFKGSLKVTSLEPVAATVVQTRPGEFATLPVAPNFAVSNGSPGAAQVRRNHLPFQTVPRLNQKLYVAQFGDGAAGGATVFSQLILFNLTGKAANVKLVLKNDDGDSLTVDLDGEVIAGEKELIIPAGGLRTLATDGEGQLIVGSLTVCSDQALAGVILFGGSAGVAGVGNSAELLRGFVAPMQSSSASSIRTGVAVMNLETKSNTLQLMLFDTENKKLATAQIELLSMGHRALFLEEIQWETEGGMQLDLSNFSGLLRVSGKGKTAASVVLTQPGVFATQPVVPALN